MNIYEFYNHRKQTPLILSLSTALSRGIHSAPALFINPPLAPHLHQELHPQHLARCSWRPLSTSLLVPRRKAGWLIPTCPNTGLPHPSPLAVCKETSLLLVLDLENPPPAAAGGPVSAPGSYSWKEREEQRPWVSPLLEEQEVRGDFSVCMFWFAVRKTSPGHLKAIQTVSKQRKKWLKVFSCNLDPQPSQQSVRCLVTFRRNEYKPGIRTELECSIFYFFFIFFYLYFLWVDIPW